MERNAIVEFRNVSKRIGKKTLVHHLNFEVPRGEVFGFLGPNGAGKTTTIRMMVGLMSISEGSILINGKDVQRDYLEAARHVGAIVENPELYKYLTGYKNLIHFSRMIPGITKERIEEVIQLVGLENRIHEKVKGYSLGMRQRLGIAQALLHKPSLLILDEPTNGLDPAGIRELRDYLRKLAREEGITVFVSSHLLSEMELMCDRVAILQNGKLVDVRTIEDLIRGGSGDKLQIEVQVDEIDRAASAMAVLGIRPDGLEENVLKLTLAREQIPEVNRILVDMQVRVYAIRTVAKSLEDKFLEITGVEQIA